MERLSWKGSSSVTLGKPHFYTVIVQVSGRQSIQPFSHETELWVNMLVLVARWSWKGHFSVTLGKTWLICSGLLGDRADLVSVIGLLGRWSCKWYTGKLLHICWGLLGDGAQWVNTLGLLGRLSCKGCAGISCAHSFRSPGNRAHWVSRVILDGLEKSLHWLHSEASTHTFRSPRIWSS